MCLELLPFKKQDEILQKLLKKAKNNKIITYKVVTKRHKKYLNWSNNSFEYKKGICVSSRASKTLKQHEERYQRIYEGIHVCLNINSLYIKPYENHKLIQLECDLNDLVGLGTDEQAVFMKVNFLREMGFCRTLWHKLTNRKL